MEQPSDRVPVVRSSEASSHEPEIANDPPLTSPDVVLDVADLVVEFPRGDTVVRPLRGVSLQVRRGQRIGLVGESGCGKSLTALAIMRLIRPPGYIAGGRVSLGDRDLLALSEQEMASVRGSGVSMIYQNPLSALNPLQTVSEQVTEAIRAHEQIDRREASQRVVELLDEVGLPYPRHRATQYPHELSGGMRQRVVIAMAICANPSLLIADEPTTALDVTTQAKIISLLNRLCEDHGLSVILITHDLGVASSFCEEIQVMYAGRIVEAAPSEAFYAHPAHPYSEALLKSIPRNDMDVSQPIAAISGQPPSPSRVPQGCSFHPRCPYVMERCRLELPPRVDPPGGNRFAECHLLTEQTGGSAKHE